MNKRNSEPGRAKPGKRSRLSVLSLIMVMSVFFTIIPLATPVYAKATIKLNTALKTLYVGQTYVLKATKTGTSKKATWTSSKKTIATVSSTGKVTAKKAGTSVITAKAGTIKATCKITVKNPSIKLNKSTASITKGASLQLKATVYGPSKKVTWTTSNKKICTVSTAGKVVGKAVGSATITAKANGKKAVCKVTVKKSPVKAFKTSDVTGIVWELSELTPQLTLKIHNGSSKTIYVSGLVEIEECTRYYTRSYEYKYHYDEHCTIDGYDYYWDHPAKNYIVIPSGGTRIIKYRGYYSNYWNSYFTKESFAHLYIGLGKGADKVYEYMYVIDIGSDGHTLKYASTFANSDRYLNSRSSGSSGGTSSTPVSSNQKRTCPFCRKSGKCSHCGGTGKQSTKTSLYGYRCSTCMGSGKCQCCNGKGVY